MDIKVLIGRRIKAIRKSRGLTQEKLCELIGIEPQSMSYMETGKFAPSPDTLQKLSDVLNVKPYEFYYFENITEKEMEKILTSAIKKDKKLLKILYNVYKSLEYSL
ncbi:helix-turn-helix transcriptional regulator [bacterium]|nr:helix-turn-helix transcriptional regulator [bacterium]